MRKNLILVGLWLAGTTLAIAVSWQGVQLIDDQVLASPALLDVGAVATSGPDATTSDESAPTIVDQSAPSTTTQTDQSSTSASVDAELDEAAVATSSTIRSTTSTSSRSTSSTSTQATSSTSVNPVTSTTVENTTSTSAGTTTTRPSTTSTTKPSTTTTTQPAAQVITYNLVGGSVAISFSSSNVSVVWATPKSGFEVKVEGGGGDARVEFENDNHRSRIDAWWEGGPRTRIREDS